MADQRIGNTLGVTIADVGGGTNRSDLNGGGTGAPQGEASLTNMTSISAMRTRLAAIDSGFYTAGKLNTMTRNDMIYAIRLNDQAGTIKQ